MKNRDSLRCGHIGTKGEPRKIGWFLGGQRRLSSLCCVGFCGYADRVADISATTGWGYKCRNHRTLETQTEQLYEDKVSGLITNERFSELVSATEGKRSEIEKRIAFLEQSTEKVANGMKTQDIQVFYKLVGAV